MAEKRDGRTSGWSWRRGRRVTVLGVLVAVLLAFPRVVPNSPGHLGSLLETFLPWLGLAVPVLLVPALLRRSAARAVALLLPAAAWPPSSAGGCSPRSRAPGARA